MKMMWLKPERDFVHIIVGMLLGMFMAIIASFIEPPTLKDFPVIIACFILYLLIIFIFWVFGKEEGEK